MPNLNRRGLFSQGFENQKGAVHILAILLLLAGLGVGVYLVQKQTNIFPKAYSPKQSAPVLPRPTRPPVSAPITEKVSICHKTSADKNIYTLISIDQNALNQHLAHNDIYPVPANGCPGNPKIKSSSP